MNIFNLQLLGSVALTLIALTTGVQQAGAALMTSFQEGVSPTGAYTHDAVYIRSNSTTTNFNSSDQIIVGTTTGASPDVLRGLLKFDISAIPASHTIDSASLILTTYSTGGLDQGGTPGNPTFNVYSYGFGISEAVSTWNDPDGDGNALTGDTSAGGTLGTFLTSATFNVTTTGLAVTFGDTAALRTAVSDSLTGDGFLRLIVAKNDESTVGTHEFARFASESFATAGSRPELLVTHSAVVPEPASIVIFATFALLSLGFHTWRRMAA